jgi:hypothetical protein
MLFALKSSVFLLSVVCASVVGPLRPFVFTVTFNQTGQPAISLLLWWTAEGLSIFWSAISGAQLCIAPGASHFWLQEMPALANRIVLDFLLGNGT